MKGKLSANTIVAFIIYPLFFFVKDLLVIDVKHYSYGLNSSSFWDYFFVFFKEYMDLFLSIGALVLILLPFQLIKDYRLKKGQELTFVQKWSLNTLLILLVILLFGSFTNIWTIPYWKNLNYILFAIGIAFLTNLFLHFTIDRIKVTT